MTIASKPILVLVNPKSGRGNSVTTLEDLIIPMLNAHEIPYEVQVTEGQLRARDVLNETNAANLTLYKSIMVVSGDGLLHETVNALMSRSDWNEAIKIPLGIVPTGSGNGMAYTLVRKQWPQLAAGKEAIRLCCKQALQNETCSTDLIKITYGINSKIWSFLSLGWGLLSDIDVDSDWLRALGELRFTIYGLLRSCTARSYRGKLSYEPKLDNSSLSEANYSGQQQTNNTTDKRENWIHIEDNFSCLYAVYQSHISSGTKFAPLSTLTDQTIYLTYIRGHLSVVQSIRFLLAIENGTHDKLPFVTVVPVERLIFEPLDPASKVVVDGDIMPWTHDDGPISVEVVPKLMTLCWSRSLSSDSQQPSS